MTQSFSFTTPDPTNSTITENVINAPSATSSPLIAARCVHHYLEEQAARTPEAIAIQAGDQCITYADLNTKANQLAHYLKRQGVKAEVAVGLCVERAIETLIGIFGILKAGGAYVPLAPTYPKPHLQRIIREARPLLLLTQPTHEQQKLFDECETPQICLDKTWHTFAEEPTEPPSVEVAPDNLAYVLFTSGSTGRPKGVTVTHKSVAVYIDALQDHFQTQASDVSLHTASFAFSSSVRQFVQPLARGAKLVIANRKQTKNPVALLQLIRREKITLLDTPPPLWDYGLQSIESMPLQEQQELKPTHLRLIALSGSIWTCQLYQKLRHFFGSSLQIFNVYGQTETIGACVFPIPQTFDRTDGVMPVGYPYPHNRVYILDEHQQPVPQGTVGELYISGASLTRGYLNRDDLTREAFVANPFVDTSDAEEASIQTEEPFARLYKTGDSARLLTNGTIELVGRVDFQIKLRGMRIEPGEIKAALVEHEDVGQAVVVARDDLPSGKGIVAYVVPTSNMTDTDSETGDRSSDEDLTQLKTELRQKAQSELPEHMVPNVFVMLEALPLNPNGKVDRLNLPAPTQADMRSAESIMPPQDALEYQLVKLWEQILGVSPIGITDSFFELGGQSLLAMELVTQIEQRFQKNVMLPDLLRLPTIAQLAQFIREDEVDRWSPLVPLKPEGSNPPFFCVHGIWGNVLDMQELAESMGSDQPYYGLQATGLDGKRAPINRIEAIAQTYIKAIQTVQPEGPYLLGGVSAGGIIAFEMAQQLTRQGHDVPLLVLFDSYGHGTFPRREFRRHHYLQYLIQSKSPKLLFLELKEKVKKRLLRAKCQRLLAQGKTVPQQERNLWIRWTYSEAYEHYSPTPFPGRIMLMQAQGFQKQTKPFMDDYSYEDWQNRDPLQGWGNMAEKGLEIFDIPGDHYSMLSLPECNFLAEQVKSCIERALPTPTAKPDHPA
ncbi:MAG: amino acid adenylation domain-containing protein [Elainellaceae cyanobacterium]